MKMRIRNIRIIQKVIYNIWTSKVDKLFPHELYLLEDGYLKKKSFACLLSALGFRCHVGFSLVAQSGGYSLSCGGFRCCGTQAGEHRLSSCGVQTWLLRGVWDLPRPGIKPMFPPLVGRFFSTEPPRKPRKKMGIFKGNMDIILWSLKGIISWILRTCHESDLVLMNLEGGKQGSFKQICLDLATTLAIYERRVSCALRRRVLSGWCLT